MWKKIKQLAGKNNSECYLKVDAIIQDKSNIVDLNSLETLSRQSVDPESCTALADVLLQKLTKYVQDGRRGRKMFKVLVMIDYLLLNGVSAFIDIFNERELFFQAIATHHDGQPKNKQFEQMIVLKSEHICRILKDKKLRLSEREYLHKAKLHFFKKPIKIEESKEIQTKGKFQRLEGYISDKLEKITVALIGLLDQDCVLYINSEGNKEFMKAGQNIIEDQEEEKQISKEGEEVRDKQGEAQREAAQAEKQSEVVKKSEVVDDNLLGLEIELL